MPVEAKLTFSNCPVLSPFYAALLNASMVLVMKSLFIVFSRFFELLRLIILVITNTLRLATINLPKRTARSSTRYLLVGHDYFAVHDHKI